MNRFSHCMAGVLLAGAAVFCVVCINDPSPSSHPAGHGRDTLAVKVCTHPPLPPVDVLDPRYLVVRPNGGEIFYVGEQCTVVVHSNNSANGILILKIRAGRYSHPLVGSTGSIDPFADTMVVFTVTDSLSINDSVKVSSISDSCYIQLNDYSTTTGYKDFSDCYFAIRKRP